MVEFDILGTKIIGSFADFSFAVKYHTPLANLLNLTVFRIFHKLKFNAQVNIFRIDIGMYVSSMEYEVFTKVRHLKKAMSRKQFCPVNLHLLF